MVGHVPTVHTCSFMCINHIDMTAHTQCFNELGALSVSAGIQTHAARVLAGRGNHSDTEVLEHLTRNHKMTTTALLDTETCNKTGHP